MKYAVLSILAASVALAQNTSFPYQHVLATTTESSSGSIPVGLGGSGLINQSQATSVQGSAVITTRSLPSGNVNMEYAATLTATGGNPPYSWGITSGLLPSGLSLTGSTGRISGVPTTTEPSSFTIGVTDAVGSTAIASLSITTNSALSGVDLLTGPYSNCPGSGCAKGDYRSGSDATVSSSNFTLNAPSGRFAARDVRKRGVAVDWHSANVRGSSDGKYCARWSGYGCYVGTSCEFTVSAVNSSTSITVSPVAGCGGSGIIKSNGGPSTWYWAVYTDDSNALNNALNAASGSTLIVPSNYSGGIYKGVSIPSNTTINCVSGGQFNDPHFNTSTTFLFTAGSGSMITGCTISGTQNPSGLWYDVIREYNIPVGIFTSNFTFTNNVVENIWGTYAVGTSGASSVNISDNTFKSCGYYGVQLAEAGGGSGTPYGGTPTKVSNNTFTDCNEGSEDGRASSSEPNRDQLIQNNFVAWGIGNGSGYYHTQKAVGGYFAGSVWLNCGTTASGGTPTSTQYAGVSCSGNTITGSDSKLFYNLGYGETQSGNTCTSGCTVRSR
jgi:putative Ig domain-containing protein